MAIRKYSELERVLRVWKPVGRPTRGNIVQRSDSDWCANEFESESPFWPCHWAMLFSDGFADQSWSRLRPRLLNSLKAFDEFIRFLKVVIISCRFKDLRVSFYKSLRENKYARKRLITNRILCFHIFLLLLINLSIFPSKNLGFR